MQQSVSQLVGLFNVHINPSGSYWDNHVFDLRVWPCLEWPFIIVSKVLLRAIGDPMTRDCHYSDHPSHYVSPRPGIEPGLTACEASMLPTTPPEGIHSKDSNDYILPYLHCSSVILISFVHIFCSILYCVFGGLRTCSKCIIFIHCVRYYHV